MDLAFIGRGFFYALFAPLFGFGLVVFGWNAFYKERRLLGAALVWIGLAVGLSGYIALGCLANISRSFCSETRTFLGATIDPEARHKA